KCYAQDVLQCLELNDKDLVKCLEVYNDSLACYDGYFRALDDNVTQVYIEVRKKLPAAKQEKLDAGQGEWQQKKHVYYGMNYINFRKKFPEADFNNLRPAEKKQLADGYRESALYARRRIIYLLSLIDK